MKKIFADQRELIVAIEKIACAGTKKNINGKAAAFDSGLDEAVARRQTIFAERRAKFDSRSSAFACSQAGLQAFDAELEGDVALHASLSEGGRTEGSVPKDVFGSGPIVKTSFPPSAISE